MASLDSENQWEYSKENVVPIKRGRSVKGLVNSLQAVEASQGNKAKEIVQCEEATERFEKELKSILELSPSSQNDESLLDVYMKHHKWIRDTYPSDNTKSLAFLERATFDLKDNETCKNSPKFIKMWCEYADSVRNPGEIFSFMQSNKIGDKCALFWVAWAFVAEKAQNYNMTDQIYQKGLKRQAAPRELVVKRYHQFQRRMARLMLDREKNGESLDLTQPVVNETTNEKTRKALGSLGSSQASSGASRLPKSNSSQQGVGGSSSSSRSHRGPRSNETFDIFVDDVASTMDGQLHENKNWKTLAKVKDSKKENVEQARKWTESGGITAPCSTSRRPEPSTAQRTFVSVPIYVDDEEEEKDKNADVIEEGCRSSSRPGLSIRATLEKAPMESLMKNPLARHKESQEESSKQPKKSSQKIVTQPLKATTANTQVAPQRSIPSGNEVESKSPKKSTSTKDQPMSSSSYNKQSHFQIFADDTETKPSTGPNGPGFTIFADENPSSSSTATTSRQERANKPEVSKPGFSIFQDFLQDSKDNNRTPVAGKSDTKLKSAKEREDDEIMGVIGLAAADNEDVTINTKLAKMDIDSMFCSPGLTPSTKQNNRLQLQRTFGNLSDIKEPTGDDADRSIFGTLATPFESSHQNLKQDSYFLNSNHKIDGLNLMKIEEDETLDGDDTIQIKNMINENFKLPGGESLAAMRKAKNATNDTSKMNSSCMSSSEFSFQGGENESWDKSGIDLSTILGGKKSGEDREDITETKTKTKTTEKNTQQSATTSTTSYTKSRSLGDFAETHLVASRSKVENHQGHHTKTSRNHTIASDCSLQTLIQHKTKPLPSISTSMSLPSEVKFTSIDSVKATKNVQVTKRKNGSSTDNDSFNMDGGVKKSRLQPYTLNARHELPDTIADVNDHNCPKTLYPESPIDRAGAMIKVDNSRRDSAFSSDNTIMRPSRSPRRLEYIDATRGNYSNDLLSRKRTYYPSHGTEKTNEKFFKARSVMKAISPDDPLTSNATTNNAKLDNTQRGSINESVSQGHPHLNVKFNETLDEGKNARKEASDADTENQHESIKKLYTSYQYPIDHIRDANNDIIRVYSSIELMATPEEGDDAYIMKSGHDSKSNTNRAIFKADNLTRRLCQQWETSLLPNLEYICAICRSKVSASSESPPVEAKDQNVDELIMIPNLQMEVPHDLGKKLIKKKSKHPCNLAIGASGMLKFDAEKVLGSGGYGYVLKSSSFSIILAKPKKYKREYKSIAIKIGEEIGYLVWETLIHKRIQLRIESKLREQYVHNFCPPIALLIYQNSSVMCMELGSLGSFISMINAVIESDNFRADEIEFLAIYFSFQALKAIHVLHSASIIHTDIKTDNWVLQTTDTEDIRLQLIDFGKAIDLREISTNTGCAQIGMMGSTAVTDFECPEMKTGTPWSYQADYYAVAACIHALLHGENMKVMFVTMDTAERKGYICPVDGVEFMESRSSKHDETECKVWIPTQPIKRYWQKKQLWRTFFFELINARKMCEKKDLSSMIDTFDDAINSKQSERLKAPTLRKLKIMLQARESRVSK